MSEQTKLEVTIPRSVATNQVINKRLQTHVRSLLRQNGGTDVSGFRKDPLFLYNDATFPDRSRAMTALKAIRTLTLDQARESARQFIYLIDNEELLVFNDSYDEHSFESRSYVEEIRKS